MTSLFRAALLLFSVISLCHRAALALRKTGVSSRTRRVDKYSGTDQHMRIPRPRVHSHGRHDTRRARNHTRTERTPSPTRAPTSPPEKPWLLAAAERTWEYFKEPYPEPPKHLSEETKRRWLSLRFEAICGVERPNHGLPNAVRKAVLVPVVLDAYRELFGGRENQYRIPGNYKGWLSKESFVFSPEMIKAAQIAVMFEVVGRQSEIGFKDDYDMHNLFRLHSLEALADYSYGSLNLVERSDIMDGTFQMYKNPVSRSSFPYQRIFEKVHDLELLRCWEEDVPMKYKIDQMEKDIGKAGTLKLLLYTEKLIEATGDNLQWRPSRTGGRRKWNCRKFSKVGRNATMCFEAVRQVKPPTFNIDEDEPLPLPHS